MSSQNWTSSINLWQAPLINWCVQVVVPLCVWMIPRWEKSGKYLFISIKLPPPKLHASNLFTLPSTKDNAVESSFHLPASAWVLIPLLFHSLYLHSSSFLVFNYSILPSMPCAPPSLEPRFLLSFLIWMGPLWTQVDLLFFNFISLLKLPFDVCFCTRGYSLFLFNSFEKGV